MEIDSSQPEEHEGAVRSFSTLVGKMTLRGDSSLLSTNFEFARKINVDLNPSGKAKFRSHQLPLKNGIHHMFDQSKV